VPESAASRAIIISFTDGKTMFKMRSGLYKPVLSAIYFLSAWCTSFLGIWSPSVNAETLTVYTYDSFTSDWGPGPRLKKLFEASCACDLKFIAAEDGVSILNRLRIEGDKSHADVVLGMDDGLLVEAKETGLFQQHKTNITSILPSLSWQDNYFVPFDFGYFAFIYDARKITEPADSFQTLLQSEAKIIYQDPRTSTPGQGLMMWVKAIYGDQASVIWQQLAAKTVTVTKGWWEAYSMFLEGAADYVLSYSTSPAYHIIAEQKHHNKAAKFSEGHIRQVEIAGITRFTNNPVLARQFLQFLLSTEAQQVIPVTNWMLPVVSNTKLPPAFAELITPVSIGFTPATIAQHRKQWINEWRSSVIR
jgi:thiamine transport system substrate-binding protein